MFGQTVMISVWGMGLTFLALGLVVLTMVVLTSLLRERKSPVQEAAQPEPELVDDGIEEVWLVAAAAVALAKAEADQRTTVNVGQSQSEKATSSWESYTRAQKLSHWKTHQSLR
jgi:Na+-transporting methylmalonyl-CoA/oxaloacetate decarboxylase gamma subunit